MRLWLFAVSLLLTTLGFCLPAAAASFDCAKAATAYEKAICADADLSAKDDTLAIAYATAIGGLTQTAAGEMRDGQRAWLKLLDTICSDAMLPDDRPASEERIGCLSNAYADRIKTLEASRMYNGLRIYNRDEYGAWPDPQGEGYYKVTTRMQSLPRIDGESELARSFNAFMDRTAADEGTSPSTKPSGDDASSDTSLTLTVKRVTANRIQLGVDTYWYGHGAAHGNYAVSYLDFLRNENRALTAADVFAGKTWQKHLADLVLAQLKTNLGDLLWEVEPKTMREIVADPSRWDISTDGLTVQFEPYEVASYADGAVTASVPWNKLTDDLAEGADNLVMYDY